MQRAREAVFCLARAQKASRASVTYILATRLQPQDKANEAILHRNASFPSSTDHSQRTHSAERALTTKPLCFEHHTLQPQMVSDALAVACGAVCGALARHNIALIATQNALAPWHIAGINTAGSAVLGAVAAAPLPPAAKLCVGVGACGA